MKRMIEMIRVAQQAIALNILFTFGRKSKKTLYLLTFSIIFLVNAPISASNLFPFHVQYLNEPQIEQYIIEYQKAFRKEADRGQTIDRFYVILNDEDLFTKQQAILHNFIGAIKFEAGLKDDAFNALRKAADLCADLNNDDPIKGMILGTYGAYLQRYNAYSLAIDYLKKSLPGIEKANRSDTYLQEKTYQRLHGAYFNIDQRDSALYYLKLNISEAERYNNINKKSKTYNTLGLYLTKKGEYEQAIEAFDEGIRIANIEDPNVNLWTLNVQESRAHPIMRLGRHEEALAILEYVYRERKKLGNTYRSAQAMGYILAYQIELGNEKQAYDYFRRESNFLNFEELRPAITNINLFKSIAQCSEKYNPSISDEFTKRYYKMIVDKNNLNSNRDRKNINAFMNFRHEAYEKGLLIKELENEQLRQQGLLNRYYSIGIISFCLLLLITGFLIARYRRIKRDRKIMDEKQKKRILALENESLKKDIEIKNQDIRRIAMDNKIRTSIKKEILERLKKIEKFDNYRLHKELFLLTSELDQAIDNQDHLNLLQENIETLNADFEKKLRTRIPGITTQQIEICNLIRLGMQNPEIAKTLNKSDTAIRTNRYRIRKKAGLEKDQTLEDLLLSL